MLIFEYNEEQKSVKVICNKKGIRFLRRKLKKLRKTEGSVHFSLPERIFNSVAEKDSHVYKASLFFINKKTTLPNESSDKKKHKKK